MAGRGKFITLEGGDGAGKSTQIGLLAEALRAAGVDVVETREPGGSAGAEQIRSLLVEGAPERWDPMTEALLHFAARREHLVQRIRPALEAGRWVISDRFADSTMAYQGYAQGVGRELVQQLFELVVGEDGPDLTLILDLPVEAGLARAQERAGNEGRYEAMGDGFQERLRQAFLAIAAEESERCLVIDASGSVESVQVAIRAAVSQRLGLSL